MAFFVLPAFLIGFYQSDKMHVIEIVGFAWTFLAYIWENVADRQKKAFLQKKKEEGVSG